MRVVICFTSNISVVLLLLFINYLSLSQSVEENQLLNMFVYNEKRILETNIYNEIFLYVFIRKQILKEKKEKKRNEVILIYFCVLFLCYL